MIIKPRTTFSLALIGIVGAAGVFTACSDSEMPDIDMGVAMMDAGVQEDSGVRALCPAHSDPVCSNSEDCQFEMNPAPTNCEFCPGYVTEGLCAAAQCQTPPRIQSSGLHEVRISVVGFQTELNSFARLVMASETTGGSYVSCQDVYDGNIDFANPCYNIMDARGSNAAPNMPDVPILTFSGFPSGQRTLFIIYGFTEEGAAGDPIGVSCTEYDVGAPTDMKVTVEGDMMRRIP